MIKAQTFVRVIDNSGGKMARCIKVKSKGNKSTAHLGDIVIISIQSLRKYYKSKVRIRVNKSEVHHGLVVQTKRFHRYANGKSVRFGRNAVVLINTKSKILGTRIFTIIPQELKNSKWSKLGVLGKGFI